ncbi:HAD family hydrolase [Oceanobacillus sojae]|uniref:HAD family hydrolase n=1 Tax=Oceanobacillus sojae TaxID=582851 RepID=UPI000988469B|nr:HAD family hydrolase [Oceanobacillus sojae]MCT1902406.1 HAD family hydrolase [Oceanobacillus sojae]
MGTKWITFDLDETIMRNPFGKWVFPDVVNMLKKETDTEEDILNLIVSEHLQRMSEERFLEAYDWDDIITDVTGNLGAGSAIDIEKMVIKHSESPKIYLLEDNMLDHLEQIKKKGFDLAAATNGYAKYQLPVLQKLGLDKMFDEIITSDSAGFAKPNPAVLKKLSDEGEIVAHVGDRIDHDVVLANKLDTTSVFIHRSLPTEILSLPMNKRTEHPSFIRLCEEKWHKENRLREAPFKENECIPKVVVQSIEELAEGIDFILK